MATAKKKVAKKASKKAAPKKAAPKKAASAKKASSGKKGAGNSAFMKPVTPSETLAEVIGSTPVPRTEVARKLWEYIKKNKLQDPAKKTMINADAKLKPIFKKPQVSMFEMNKLISKHLS